MLQVRKEWQSDHDADTTTFVTGSCRIPMCQKKTPAQGWRKVIEAGFIQARNLSSSKLFISNWLPAAKLKV
jgi:hypothetical protein